VRTLLEHPGKSRNTERKGKGERDHKIRRVQMSFF